MTEQRPTLAHLAGEYGLKTAQGFEAAHDLGLNLKRGAARVAPWQEKLLRPELARIAWKRKARKAHAAGPVKYEVADNRSRYLYDDEETEFGFANSEMARQLAPILERMLDQDKRHGN